MNDSQDGESTESHEQEELSSQSEFTAEFDREGLRNRFGSGHDHHKIETETGSSISPDVAAESVGNDPNEDEPACRICRMTQSESPPGMELFCPCKCTGSLAYVHVSCLNQWRQTSQTALTECSVCKHKYILQKGSAITSLLSNRKFVIVASSILLLLASFLCGAGVLWMSQTVVNVDFYRVMSLVLKNGVSQPIRWNEVDEMETICARGWEVQSQEQHRTFDRYFTYFSAGHRGSYESYIANYPRHSLQLCEICDHWGSSTNSQMHYFCEAYLCYYFIAWLKHSEKLALRLSCEPIIYFIWKSLAVGAAIFGLVGFTGQLLNEMRIVFKECCRAAGIRLPVAWFGPPEMDAANNFIHFGMKLMRYVLVFYSMLHSKDISRLATGFFMVTIILVEWLSSKSIEFAAHLENTIVPPDRANAPH